MAPSLATLTQSTVPVQQSSTIKVMSEKVINYMDYQKKTSTQLEGNSDVAAEERHTYTSMQIEDFVTSIASAEGNLPLRLRGSRALRTDLQLPSLPLSDFCHSQKRKWMW